jgi:capsule polysaccharide export protein KpsE/RkpR
MTEIKHDDDVGTQMALMIHATNEVVKLTQELITVGTALNEVRGKFHEIKARIKAEKEKINSLKVVIRAESSISGGF